MKDSLKITFLGTGTSQGIPVIGSKHPVCLSNNSKDKRLRTSVLLSWDEHNYVIDCGPDFRQQMLRHNVENLDGILFTHEHSDHTAGLDDIRPYFFKQGDIPIYANQDVINSLKRRFDYIFADENRYPGAPAVKVNLINSECVLNLGGKKITVVEAWHNRLKVFGFSVDGFTYLTDIKRVDALELEKIKNSKVLVINALRLEPHHSHLNLEEALEFVDLVKPEVAYFTHISHMLGFHEIVDKELPENVHLAFDGLTIKV
ncbi:MBL fold metallo-hydrolase [Aurantibacter sp.]|uniref:MBL fold metallo-hydrolase n=1 Tax=Aurantibacter sp. TaxID=2807103 RepID=UPI003263909A